MTNYLKVLYLICTINLYPLSISSQNNPVPSQYVSIQNSLKNGWGTYDCRSVFNHVLLPDGLSLKLCFNRISHGNKDNFLSESFISWNGPKPEKITPGLHAYNSSYTELTCEWQGSTFKIESAVYESELYLLIFPINIPEVAPSVVLEVGMLWNRNGIIALNSNEINVQLPSKKILIKSTNPIFADQIPLIISYLSVALDQPVTFYMGVGRKTLDEIKF